jgi:hypothetical protein
VVAMIIKLLSFAFMVSQKCNQNVTNIALLCAMIMADTISANYSFLKDNLIRAVQGIIDHVKCVIGMQDKALVNVMDIDQSEIYYEAQVDSTSNNFIICMFDVIKFSFKSMFGDMPDDTFNKLTLSVKKVEVFNRSLKSLTTVYEVFSSAISFVVEQLGEKLMKHYNILPMFLRSQDIDGIIERYRVYKVDDMYEQSKSNVFKGEFVKKLYNDLREL